ncbi:MAG: hypothetical protein DI630_00185 [Gordonia sp. (in: high G+C Gram-positive bacteria)]|nr:MAG: hypothetical protein DI630_00185 [Gordonia sp. (in: high G+C Gram-positive bacteria)]
MSLPQLAPSSYAQDLTEAAATTLISTENLHRDAGETATEALLWAIDNGGLFTFEQAVTLLVDQVVNIHEEQRVALGAPEATPPAIDMAATAARTDAHAGSVPVVIADWLPTGSDEEDRILSLLSLEPC